MSRKFKSQASSSRAATHGFGGAFSTTASPLSYVSEPPDLSGITDANLVVSFKNLSKKDSTTKAKALEEIQSSLSNVGEIEDAVVEAWVKIYPRTSIDNSRRVRQLAHSVQGQISVAVGKRIVKHVPEAAGAWLSGLYDNDRSVTKSTNDSFALVFSTPEKLHNVRKAFQAAILDYCRNVIEQESIQTLSDERTVTPDDAEAKYSRVISAAIGVIGDLLIQLSAEETAKQEHSYTETFGNDQLWDLISNKDAQVRRAILRLLRICLTKQPDVISANLKHISKCLLSHGLSCDQTGSALDYVTTVTALTKVHPTIWTDSYSSKKTADHRLRSFLKRGSQLGPREFWSLIPQLLQAVPRDAFLTTVDDAVDLLTAVHAGIIKKEEPRTNLAAALDSYVLVAKLALDQLQNDEQTKVAREMLYPLILQYIKPMADTAQWTIPAPQATSILAKLIAIRSVADVLVSEWPQLSNDLVEAVKVSAPEQSSEFQHSQDATVELGKRWANVQIAQGKQTMHEPLASTFAAQSKRVAEECIDILRTRNGKPYSAASILETLVQKSSGSTRDEILALLSPFLGNDLSKLVLSPSSKYVISILYLSHEMSTFSQAWTSALDTILASDDSNVKTTTIDQFLSSQSMPSELKIAASSGALQAYVLEKLRLSLASDSDWTNVGRIVRESDKLLASATVDSMLVEMTKGLSIADKTQPSIHAIEQVASNNPALLREFIPTAEGTNLLRSLLLLGESADEHIAQEASALSASIEALLRQDSSDPSTSQAVFKLIRNGLSEATSNSVTVETLVELARKALNDHNAKVSEILANVLPAKEVWSTALEPYLDVSPAKPFAMTNALGGTLYLIPPSAGRQPGDLVRLPRDVNGFSSAYRIASYVTEILKDHGLIAQVSVEARASILQHLALTVELANDNLSLAGSNPLWTNFTSEIETDAQDFIFDAQSLLDYWLQGCANWWSNENADSDFTFVQTTINNLYAQIDDRNPSSFYKARAFSKLNGELGEMHGWPSKRTTTIEDTFRSARKARNVFAIASLLSGYRVPLSSSKLAERACNEMVADLTGMDANTKTTETIQNLALLNLSLQYQDGIVDSIAKQRIVFFVKKAINWLQDEHILETIKAETCAALAALFPAMKDMYGDHWNETLAFITRTWLGTKPLDSPAEQNQSPIALAHASLKLYGTLSKLSQEEEPNDDLVDAWKEAQEAAAKGLINLLKQSQGFPDEYHQPLRIVNELLARHISKTSLKHIEEPSELYPLLYVQSGPVQKTAFDILHKQIPATQEQISFDAALDKKDARLPEELISLVLEAPTAEALNGVSFDRTIPLPLRGYLFSWLLIFDHFNATTTSYTVKTSYVAHLKENSLLPDLLDFMFSFLGHTKGKPIDASKLPSPVSYTPETLDPPLTDCHHLLIHLYYLSLLHLPTLTKSFFIDLKSRQTVLAVGSWTEKFLTPHIIITTFAVVAEWSTSQATEGEDETERLSVKSSPRTREITASYTVDEQTLSFRIILPPTYPLHPARVEGLHRVAVSQQKWEAWLRTTAGIITFSNGSVVDGLVGFKRNIVGAIKGQTECAICYSIVGSDRQLPSKRCSTCKNSFHGGCLFRWFKSSGGSSCPLCRNPFNYG